jgi:hypothetical protein
MKSLVHHLTLNGLGRTILPMRSDGLLKHLAISLAIAVAFYVLFFGWLQHRRNVKGPWVVDFRGDAAGVPSLFISQTNLNVSETIVFPGKAAGSSNFSRTIAFRELPPDLPFGELVFQDPTFLPGTVTIRLYGHLVEFLPRVLIVDKTEYPWQAGAVIQLH